MSSSKTLARLAGILYLIVAVGGGFSEYVRLSVRVRGDAAATAANVAEHASLFRLGFVADLVDFACFLAVGLLLYAILKPAGPRIAVSMLALNAVSVAIQALNMLNHLGALLVATDRTYTTGLSSDTVAGLVALLLDMHAQGYLIAQIFFGLFLLPLGYLVYRSGLFPRVLGRILMIGSGGYVAGVVATYLSPGFESSLAFYFGIAGGLAELTFLVWLLIAGVNDLPTRQAISVEGALA
ncbi:MAG TPA: DUF4386 domain-containing protein [Verrucomicrobiae bacterium]|nr:DUF4386 domain-containing protein [Verrucomicrobiae bacterium]